MLICKKEPQATHAPVRSQEPLHETKMEPKKAFIKKACRALLLSGAAAALTSAGTIAGAKAYWHHYQDEAQSLPHKDEGLAILISYGTISWWDRASVPVGELFIPDYVARMELAFGQKADRVIIRATKEDLLEVMKDEKIQNIVLFGHGTWTSWLATDSSVTQHNLRQSFEERKRGLLVRHTCGMDKLFWGESYNGRAVQDALSERESALNERLKQNTFEDNFVKVQFVPSTKAEDERADNSTDGYDIQFLVMDGERFLASARMSRPGYSDLMDNHADAEKLYGIEFRETYELTGHPFLAGNLYLEEDLEEIAGFVNVAHSTVERSLVSVPKVRVTFGEGVFDSGRIIIVEGVNYPWKWMGEPFGPEKKELDQYR